MKKFIILSILALFVSTALSQDVYARPIQKNNKIGFELQVDGRADIVVNKIAVEADAKANIVVGEIRVVATSSPFVKRRLIEIVINPNDVVLEGENVNVVNIGAKDLNFNDNFELEIE